jgi:Family of unknown function (DUF6335)
MEEKKENQFIDADKFLGSYEAKIESYNPSPEVIEEFVEVAKLASGFQLLMKELRVHHSKTPKLSADDIDAAWDRADVGEETVGGSSPTPDQDVVDKLGLAVGLIYADNEPLDTEVKIAKRDLQRWELDPASSEGYKKRVNFKGEYEIA